MIHLITNQGTGSDCSCQNNRDCFMWMLMIVGFCSFMLGIIFTVTGFASCDDENEKCDDKKDYQKVAIVCWIVFGCEMLFFFCVCIFHHCRERKTENNYTSV